MSFDAWGRRRNPTDWTYTGIPATHVVDRGYTGHEHLDAYGLINMNGRAYDPIVGRFLSHDNKVNSPTDTQSYNMYSYCLNNPLKNTDPTGWSVIDVGPNSSGDGGLGKAMSDEMGLLSCSGYDAKSATFENGQVTGLRPLNPSNVPIYLEGDEAKEAVRNIQDGYSIEAVTIFDTDYALFSIGSNEITVSKEKGASFSNPTAFAIKASIWNLSNGGRSSNGGGNLSTPNNWTNGAGVGLGAISASVGRAIGNELAYVNTTSLIKPIQTMLKVGPANLLVSNTLSKTLTRAGVGLSAVSALITVADAYNKGEWQGHHTADLIVNGTLTGLSIVCPAAGLVVGGIYFVGDITSQYYTGKSITENLFDQ